MQPGCACTACRIRAAASCSGRHIHSVLRVDPVLVVAVLAPAATAPASPSAGSGAQSRYSPGVRQRQVAAAPGQLAEDVVDPLRPLEPPVAEQLRVVGRDDHRRERHAAARPASPGRGSGGRSRGRASWPSRAAQSGLYSCLCSPGPVMRWYLMPVCERMPLAYWNGSR